LGENRANILVLGIWASVSEPHLIMLTCEPHTSGTQVVLICDAIVNLGHEITCNIQSYTLASHQYYR